MSTHKVLAGVIASTMFVTTLASTTGAFAAQPRSPWDTIQSWETGTVQRIVDGDTMIVTDDVTGAKSRIRFIGINAPEIDTAIKGGQCGGWQAKDALAELAPVGTKVRLASLDRSSRGKDARPQRTVLAWNPATQAYDLDLAWAMAERGWGHWFTVPREAAMSSLYRDVIKGAQQRKVGIWNPALCGEVEQPDANILLRINRTETSTVNNEWVTVRNTGAAPVDLSGWRIRDTGNAGLYTFPDGSVLNPGDYRTIRSGKGAPGGIDGRTLYIGSNQKLYQNPGTGQYLVGDAVYLLDRYGNYRFTREYPCHNGCDLDPLEGDIVISEVNLGKKKGKKRAATQYVRLLNQGLTTKCLDGYRIKTGNTTYRFAAGTCLEPGATFTLHGGKKTSTPNEQYLKRSVPMLWASGDLKLISDREQVMAERVW